MKLTCLLLIFSLSTFANPRLVNQIFENGVKEVQPYLNFSPKYELHVSDEQLIDNRGSLVDAIGVVGKITLNEESWINFYRLGVDVRLLVIHELMRSEGIDDDGYEHSLPIYQDIIQTEDLSKRRDKTPYCLLKVSEFSFKEKNKKVKGCGKKSAYDQWFYKFS